MKLIADVIEKQGIPTSISGWIGFAIALGTGIGLILSKDYDKSNAPVPVAEAKTVPS